MLTKCVCSDGIARVYGMSNVQAEELVEYVTSSNAEELEMLMLSGLPPVSKACA